MKHLKSVLVLLIFLFILHGVFGSIIHIKAPLILLDNETKRYEPGNSILLLEDKTGKLTFNQILDSIPGFKLHNKGIINLGPTSSAIWCIFNIKSITQEKWYIEIGEAYIDKIDVYIIGKPGEIQHLETGLFRNYKKRPIKINHYLLPLNLSSGDEKTIVIRASSSTILKLPIAISSILTHYEHNHKLDFFFGLYFGLILALSIYNFFVFVTIRDITYLYYVFYINFLGATISWLKGYSPEFLNFLPLQINHGNLFAVLSFSFLVSFTNSFLNVKEMIPKLKWTITFFIIFNLVSLLINLLGFFRIGFYMIMIWVILAVPYVVILGIFALKKGFKPARFYILGFSIFTLGDLIFMLNENAIIHQSFLTQYSLQIGSAAEAIILSFALAHKLNSFKRDKEITQARALIQANRFTKELIETQEAERKRIAGELHDSVGQSLSLIKNKIALLIKGFNAQHSLDELNGMVTGTIQEVRSISYGLRPFQLDILGLTQSVKSLVDDVADASEIHFVQKIENIDGLFTQKDEINIFRIVQECLNNIIKHSKAVEAKVEINKLNNHIDVLIEDNGVGLPESNGGSGMGLIGIKERVNILGGKLNITNKFPQGTVVKISIGLVHKAIKPEV